MQAIRRRLCGGAASNVEQVVSSGREWLGLKQGALGPGLDETPHRVGAKGRTLHAIRKDKEEALHFRRQTLHP